MPDGQWYWNDKTQNTWSNYTQCYRQPLVMINITDGQANNITLIKVNEKFERFSVSLSFERIQSERQRRMSHGLIVRWTTEMRRSIGITRKGKWCDISCPSRRQTRVMNDAPSIGGASWCLAELGRSVNFQTWMIMNQAGGKMNQ